MSMKYAMRCATAVSLALALSTSYAAGDDNKSQPMTGKQKATAIGATTGAVAGAVVGGPVGAVVGAGIGKVSSTNGKTSTMTATDGTVRSAQAALNDQGYNVAVDGQFGPNTQSAVRRFQADRGLAQTGTLDGATLSALGVNR